LINAVLLFASERYRHVDNYPWTISDLDINNISIRSCIYLRHRCTMAAPNSTEEMASAPNSTQETSKRKRLDDDVDESGPWNLEQQPRSSGVSSTLPASLHPPELCDNLNTRPKALTRTPTEPFIDINVDSVNDLNTTSRARNSRVLTRQYAMYLEFDGDCGSCLEGIRSVKKVRISMDEKDIGK